MHKQQSQWSQSMRIGGLMRTFVEVVAKFGTLYSPRSNYTRVALNVKKCVRGRAVKSAALLQ